MLAGHLDDFLWETQSIIWQLYRNLSKAGTEAVLAVSFGTVYIAGVNVKVAQKGKLVCQDAG